MKIQRKSGPSIVIGKRVTVGAIIGAIAAGFGNIWPEHAPAILAFSPAVIGLVQILIANHYGVTSTE